MEGVEHVEGSGVYSRRCTCLISCFAVRNLCRERSGWGYFSISDAKHWKHFGPAAIMYGLSLQKNM